MPKSEFRATILSPMSSLYPSLFFLGTTLGTHLTPLPSVLSAAEDITAVVESEDALPGFGEGPEGRAESARLLMAWTWKETGWSNTIGVPEGYGPGMVSSVWFGVPAIGLTAPQVTASRVEGFRLAFRVMRYLIVQCKGVHAGLGAYAGRKCGDAQGLVSWRLHLAGVRVE